MERYINDFNYFWDLIERKQNFAFARYADGELALMRGHEIGQNTQAFKVDKWGAPAKISRVGADLVDTLNHEEYNYYYAISAVSDNYSDYNNLKTNIKQKDCNITFANLWINANYSRTLNKYKTLKRDVILIVNENAKSENYPFTVKEIFKFPNDCIKYWENNYQQFMNELYDYIKLNNIENQLFFIACGPVSEIIIHKLYTVYPNNTYVDVGSSLDEWTHGYKTRPYMDSNSQYANEISRF